MKSFVTHADAAATTDLQEDVSYWVYGATVADDAGQGWFKYDAAGAGSASNDIIVVTSPGGRLFRVTPRNSLVSVTPASGAEFVVSAHPPTVWRCGFDKAVTNDVDTAFLGLLQTGTGMTVNQTAGSLLVTSGTTINSETIIRSVEPFTGNFVMRYSTLLSQRIVNQNFFIELVDVIGDSLAVVVNSATSVTVTIPSSPFTAGNVGQFINIGKIAGVAGIPGRWAIASTSGDNVTFTVAGWPGTGSGTVSLFGWNYHQITYTGASATSVNIDSQRNGYASGVTSATINTTASTHVGTYACVDGEIVYMDQVGGSATGLETTRRASRVRNVVNADTVLYLQIRVLNGTSAPATTTTWTLGVVDMSNFTPHSVTLAAVSPMSANSGMPVEVVNTAPVTITSGTVTTVSTVTNLATIGTSITPGIGAGNLGKAEDAAHASGDTGVAILAVRLDTAATGVGASGDYENLHTDALGALRVTVDSAGSGATGLTKLEDAVHASGDAGVMALVVRQDTDATLSSATGDYAPMTVDALSRLKVNLGVGALLPLKLEDAAHASGDAGVMLLGVRKDTAASSSDTTGDYEPLSLDNLGQLRTVSSADGLTTDSAAADSTATASQIAVLKAILRETMSTAPITVGGMTPTISYTLSSATGALAAGDIIATTEALANLMRANDTTGVLQSLVLIDEADQKVALDIYFLSANTSMGTEDAAPSISDAGAADILGIVSVATTDYKNLGGVSVACIRGIGLPLAPATGTRTVYVAVVNGAGTPTYGSAGALKLRLAPFHD